MAQHNDLGKLGEELAVDFLLKKGYEILETNWTFQKAEIDIIAKIDTKLAVIEVKTRSSLDFGLPQDFVKPKKIQLLVKAINEYVISKDLEVEVRFDIIAITASNTLSLPIQKGEKTFKIDHLIDAFYHF
jgi:putative endonuclease